jgi:hypothetical protein
MRRMFSFVRTELQPLIGLSFDDAETGLDRKTAKLASKILANAGDAELEPLRSTMGMSRTEFEEGVFCWKGFIFYKWTLKDLLTKVRPVAREIAQVRSAGPATSDEKAYILSRRRSLEKAIVGACNTVRESLKVYDDAFADLTRNGQPQAFKAFLLKAPTLFYELGERLGAVQHITTFWRFRFPGGPGSQIGAEDLMDILMDFESSLSFGDTAPGLAA